VFQALKAAGLHFRDWIIWAESFGQHRAGNFGRCGRHLLYFCKSPTARTFNGAAIRVESARLTVYGDKRADPDGKVPGNVWTDIPRLCGTSAERVAPLDAEHKLPTQLPIALVERVVLAASNAGDVVADPFCGTGTTGVVCRRHGRSFVGIEPEAKTAELARRRLAAADAEQRKAAA
jgi:DNA modification methylase